MIVEQIVMSEWKCQLFGIFKAEQKRFGWQTTAKSCQAAVTANNPVARNNNGYRVATIGAAHSSNGFGLTNIMCNRTITYSASKWNFKQFAPDAALKIGAGWCQWQIELLQLTSKV